MAIWADKNTRVIVQGITGREGTFHAIQCRDYGTQVVGGVTPGKGGTTHEGFAVFNSVREAREKEGANCSLIFVPPPFAADAIMEVGRRRHRADHLHHRGHPGERHDPGARLSEEVERARVARGATPSRLIGPNCPGIITPGQAKIGIMPGHIHQPGSDRHRLALGNADVRGGRPDARASASRPRSASAAIRCRARTSSIAWPPSRTIPPPRRSS